MVTRITMTILMTVVVDYWMMKMIIMMIMTITMTTVCFFCQSNCVQILVRTMQHVKADLLRKVIGVCVPLDLRVRFAKEVNTTIMLIS